MAMSYHRVFKVPTWVVLNKMTKNRNKAVAEWLAEAGARLQEWPGNTFPKALLAWRGKGYDHALPAFPFVVDTQLLVRAAAEHVKDTLGPTSYLAGSTGLPANRLNRRATNEEDLVGIFNDLFSLEEPIAMSQMFQVAELCHRDDIARSKVWVTPGPAPKSLLTRVADRVISIGDEPNNDLVVGEVEKDKLAETLENFFKTL